MWPWLPERVVVVHIPCVLLLTMRWTSERATARSGALACCKALSVCVRVLAFVAVSGSLLYIYRV